MERNPRKSGLAVKRLWDVVFSFFALLLLSPLLALISWNILLHSPGESVIFKQLRTGRNGKCFILYKFRTMTTERGPNGMLLPDHLRLKSWGVSLRRSSLDELPQLVNVLKGEMSLIGPRPLLPEYMKFYSSQQLRRHEMRPGISGLSAIMGRNALSWEEKFAYDLEYVDRWSIALDIKIAFRTLRTAFYEKKGIKGYEYAEKFHGSKKDSNPSEEKTVSDRKSPS